MKKQYNKSLVGGALAFIIASSCCWLPALIVAVGGGSTLVGLSDGLGSYKGLFILMGIGFLAYGIYQYKKKSFIITEEILLSTISCPECGHKKEEKMPTNACQYFYECQNCKKVLKPSGNDCCVYCSYGTVPCPPIQLDQECC